MFHSSHELSTPPSLRQRAHTGLTRRSRRTSDSKPDGKTPFAEAESRTPTVARLRRGRIGGEADRRSGVSTVALGRGGLRRRCLCKDKLAVLEVDADRVAFGELALEEPQRQRVLDEALDCALQRAGAVGRVPAGLGEVLLGGVGQLEAQAALGEAVAEPRQLELHDLADLLPRQRLELDDLVDPVEELGPERLARRLFA